MANINKVIISGRLTRNAELRATPGGMSVMTLGVAVNDRRRNAQTQQWEDYTNYIDCTMFGNRAESLSKILTKGMLVCVEGRLRWSQWERDGVKRSKIEVIIDEIELPSNPRSNQDGAAQDYAAQGGVYGSQAQMGQGYSEGSYASPAPRPMADQAYDEEIPF